MVQGLGCLRVLLSGSRTLGGLGEGALGGGGV